MKKHNPSNERIKRKYFIYLKEAKRHNEVTVDGVAQALSRFEQYNKHKDFKLFHIEQAVGFKKFLSNQKNSRSGKNLSKATLNSTLGHLKRFFQWLADKPGYKSRISYSDADYFNLSEKETRIANTRQPKNVPSLQQIRRVLEIMPTHSDIDLRNRAIIAFTTLTGTRDSATASLRLSHINLKNNSIYQDAKEVNTKYSKSFTTTFFPVGHDIRGIVEDWVHYLNDELSWSDNDPLFPKTEVGIRENMQFGPIGLAREHWQTTTPIRKIFKDAFGAAGLPYYNPHSFRDTLVRLGLQLCGPPEEFKAWSQNLGHEEVMTTFNSYGEVAEDRQSEIIQSLSHKDINQRINKEEIANTVALVMTELSKKNKSTQ